MSLPIVLAAHAAIALGTLSGGWRIVRTMGTKITRLQPVGGFAAETAAAATLFGTATLGIPVSTTHTITGSLVGVGCAERFSAVRWSVMRRVLYAWVLTIPGAAAIAAASLVLLRTVPLPLLIPLMLAAGLLIAVRWRSRRPAAITSGPGGEPAPLTTHATHALAVDRDPAVEAERLGAASGGVS